MRVSMWPMADMAYGTMSRMADEQIVDVTYRGLVIGERLRLRPLDALAAHIEYASPMPVGTELVVVGEGGVRLPVRVARVHERHDGATEPAGMRVAASAPEVIWPWWSRDQAPTTPVVRETPLASEPVEEAAIAADAGEPGVAADPELAASEPMEPERHHASESEPTEAEAATVEPAGAVVEASGELMVADAVLPEASVSDAEPVASQASESAAEPEVSEAAPEEPAPSRRAKTLTGPESVRGKRGRGKRRRR